jgi:hypothetical protein
MKNIIYLCLTIVTFFFTSCVDDYTDSNPPHLLDAPTLRISNSEGEGNILTTVTKNPYQYGYAATVPYTSPVTYTVSIIDAPGKIGEISVAASIPEYGTATLDDASVAAIQGKEKGDFNFTFTPNADFSEFPDRVLNLVVTVSDSQKNDKGEASPLSTTLTMPVTLAKCTTDDITPGVYMVTAASGELDGGTAYTLDDIVADAGGDIYVQITKVRPGWYTIDEVTGGIWPTYYSTRANPALGVDLCGTEISGHSGAVTTGAGGGAQRKFTINGTLNGDGTIDISWTYVREAGAPPSSYAIGTYTLTFVE